MILTYISICDIVLQKIEFVEEVGGCRMEEFAEAVVWVVIPFIILIFWVVYDVKMISRGVRESKERKREINESKSSVWTEYNAIAQKLAYVHELQRKGGLKGFYVTKSHILTYELHIILDNTDRAFNEAINIYENHKKFIFDQYAPKENLNYIELAERDRKIHEYVNNDVNDAMWFILFGDASKEQLLDRSFDFFWCPDSEMKIAYELGCVGKTSDGKYTYKIAYFYLGHVGSDELERKTHNEAMKMICQAISAEFGSNYILNEQGNSVYYYFF